MPWLNNCCFCVDLRTGGKVLSILTLVFNILVLIGCIIGLAAVTSIDPKTVDPQTLVLAKVLASVGLIMSILSIVAAVYLILAVNKSRPGYAKPYLIISGISSVFSILQLLGAFVQISKGAITGGAFTQQLFSTGFSCYLWACVYSLYQVLKEDHGHVSLGV